MRRRFRALPPAAKFVIVVLAIVVTMNLAVFFADRVWTTPSGETGSSNATVSTGLSAWASLLNQNGIQIVEEARPIESLDISSSDVLVIDDVSMNNVKTEATKSYLSSGATVVVIGSSNFAFGSLLAVSNGGEIWDSTLPGVSEVRTSESVGWESAPNPILFDGDTSYAYETNQFGGRLIAMIDNDPLSNKFLDQNDNALFALQFIGKPQSVHFAEYEHGLNGKSGFGALPIPAQRVMYALLGCFALISWAAAVRMGPPDDEAPAQPPRRFAFTESLASRLAKRKMSRQPTFFDEDVGKPEDVSELIDLVNSEIKKRGKHNVSSK